ncbi:glutaredoxin-like protein NrdH [Mycobacterium asiaticum]|uniref:Glutaredoxin-like protein NrdH n=1 Tax=Mycobacterium asiaticum TaxID=1790 RepID=A0A1A3L152_MYCAS|nr:glutaredoxin-like protein NrdH [Mycobacterium asiaticum]OBJ90338.1 NrdH-redoxin [Mycobacterium asiaticum]
MREVIVYTKPACVQCVATTKALDKAGIAYRTIDVGADQAARDYVMSLGYLSAPVIHLSPTEHWAGFRPDRLRRICAA